MSAATAFWLFKTILSLAMIFARKAEKAQVEKALANEIKIIHREHVDRAVSVGTSANVSDSKDDPYRRD